MTASGDPFLAMSVSGGGVILVPTGWPLVVQVAPEPPPDVTASALKLHWFGCHFSLSGAESGATLTSNLPLT